MGQKARRHSGRYRSPFPGPALACARFRARLVRFRDVAETGTYGLGIWGGAGKLAAGQVGGLIKFVRVGFVYDKRRLGRIHPATLWLAAVLIPIHAATPFFSNSEWWRAIVPALLAMT